MPAPFDLGLEPELGGPQMEMEMPGTPHSERKRKAQEEAEARKRARLTGDLGRGACGRARRRRGPSNGSRNTSPIRRCELCTQLTSRPCLDHQSPCVSQLWGELPQALHTMVRAMCPGEGHKFMMDMDGEHGTTEAVGFKVHPVWCYLGIL